MENIGKSHGYILVCSVDEKTSQDMVAYYYPKIEPPIKLLDPGRGFVRLTLRQPEAGFQLLNQTIYSNTEQLKLHFARGWRCGFLDIYQSLKLDGFILVCNVDE